MLGLFYDTNGVPQPVDVTEGKVHVLDGNIDDAIDGITTALVTIEYEHHEIHKGYSFTAYYTITTAPTIGHRSGLYIKTPATPSLCHVIVSFSASTAAYFSICEAPTIASDIGTHGVAIYNRYRDSIITSGCFDNDNPAVVNKYTTLSEAEISGDVTWDTGTILRTEPLEIGAGPKPAGAEGRGEQEYILKANTAYVFLITNTASSANAHHILLDWYEHTNLNI